MEPAYWEGFFCPDSPFLNFVQIDPGFNFFLEILSGWMYMGIFGPDPVFGSIFVIPIPR